MMFKCVVVVNFLLMFIWCKGKDEINYGFNSMWNLSFLKVIFIGNGDFISYVCIVKNRFGWDLVIFDL